MEYYITDRIKLEGVDTRSTYIFRASLWGHVEIALLVTDYISSM